MDPKRYHFTFDPRKKGLRKILGDLEADVMEAMWARGRATVHDVHERLAAADRELAYTTVMTVMSRLADKGLLESGRRARPTCTCRPRARRSSPGAPSARC
jgi:predicted transcriptional regulator